MAAPNPEDVGKVCSLGWRWRAELTRRGGSRQPAHLPPIIVLAACLHGRRASPAGLPSPHRQAFIEYYYNTFSTNRAALGTLYQDASMLTFEGQKFQGPTAIVGKLTTLPFTQCKVAPTSLDFQPSVSGGIIVFVTGSIQVC